MTYSLLKDSLTTARDLVSRKRMSLRKNSDNDVNVNSRETRNASDGETSATKGQFSKPRRFQHEDNTVPDADKLGSRYRAVRSGPTTLQPLQPLGISAPNLYSYLGYSTYEIIHLMRF